MNKKALLAGAIAVSSLIALSSCEYWWDYEFTEAKTFEDAYDLFKTFFAKTFEHTNMEVSIKRRKDFLEDAETGKWAESESEETEVILGESSYRYNKDGSREDWAFVDDGQKIVATQKTIALEDETTSKEQTYRSGEASYQGSYKGYIKELNFFEAIANEAASTGKTPEEVGGFDSVEWTGIQRHTDYNKGKREHWESYSCSLIAHDGEDDGLGDMVHSLGAVFYGDEGLVESCDYAYDIHENGKYIGWESLTFEFKYNCVDKIDLPDVSGWELKNQ